MAEYVSAVYNFLYKKKDTNSNVELLLGYQGNPFLFNNWNYTKEDINLTAQNITFNCEKFSTSGKWLKIENNEFYKQVNETFQGEENSWASPVYHYTLNTAYTTISEFYTAACKEVADGYRDNWMLINNKWVLSSTMSHFTVLELDWDQLRLYSNRYSASGGWSGFYERKLLVNSAIFADEESTDENSIHNRLNAIEDNYVWLIEDITLEETYISSIQLQVGKTVSTLPTKISELNSLCVGCSGRQKTTSGDRVQDAVIAYDYNGNTIYFLEWVSDAWKKKSFSVTSYSLTKKKIRIIPE